VVILYTNCCRCLYLLYFYTYYTYYTYLPTLNSSQIFLTLSTLSGNQKCKKRLVNPKCTYTNIRERDGIDITLVVYICNTGLRILIINKSLHLSHLWFVESIKMFKVFKRERERDGMNIALVCYTLETH